jgi:NADPH2:quinone reductase
VTEVQVGDRVGYAAVIGAYAESRLIAADRLVPLPDSIDDRTAAAMLLQGLTAQYLLFQVYRVQPGDTILVHAAAGGVGLILASGPPRSASR